jgi:uncharacterized protein (UPF0248 family)
MKKPFFSIDKLIKWYELNKPEEALLMKLNNDYKINIEVIDDGVLNETQINITDIEEETNELLIEVNDVIEDVKLRFILVDEEDNIPFERIIIQPSKDAWIVWKDEE